MKSPTRRGRLAAIVTVGALAAGLAVGPSVVQAYDLPKSATTDARVADLEQAVNDVHRRLCGHYPADSECTPPDTTLAGAPSSPTSSNSATLSFTSTETGSRFECSLDAAAYAACTSPAALAALADGAHNFAVRAIDTYGNADASPASASWTVDTAAPNTTITANPGASTQATTASFSFTATEAGTFACQLDGAAYAACTSPKTYSGLAVGSHTFSVRATDAAGNTDASPAVHTWTITAPPPPAGAKPRMGGTVSANTDWAGWEAAMGTSEYRRTYDGALPASFAASKAGSAGDVPAGRESVWSYKPAITSTGLSQASQDALLAFLRTVPVGHRFTLVVYHEPEDNLNATFTFAGWKEAQRQAGTLVDQVNTEKGASSKLRLGISIMGPWSFDSRSAYSGYDWTFTAAQLAAIDVVGIDPYFWNAGDPTMEQMLTHDNSGTGAGTSNSAMAHIDAWGKPIAFMEWGTTRTGRSDSQRATDITGTYNWVKARNADGLSSTQQIEGLIYFHLDPNVDANHRDLWKVIGFPLAEAALRNAMADSRTP